MALFGAPPEMLQQAQEEVHVEVWPENWPIVSAFLDCVTQWRLEDGRRVGLDYASVVAFLGVRWPDRVGEILTGMQVMEGAALEEFGKG